MKNYVPLILSVCLGVAAVLAVSRLISKNDPIPQAMTSVVSPSHDIEAGDILGEGDLVKKDVLRRDRPHGVFLWKDASDLLGQTVTQDLKDGDYIYASSIKLPGGGQSIIGEGEVGVDMSISKSGMTPFLRPGNEIMLVSTTTANRLAEKKDALGEFLNVKETATTAVFPKLRILDIVHDDRESSLLLSMRPADAMLLKRAVATSEVNVFLRRTDDSSNSTRQDIPYLVDESTFPQLLEGLHQYTVPLKVGKISQR